MSQPTSTDQHVPAIAGNGLRIPLNPPAPLTKEDGSFDREKFHRHVSSIVRKRHRAHAQDLGLHLGGVALKPDPIPLKDGVRLWTVAITIGSNNQPFAVNIDTGSADLWVPNVKCEHPSLERHSYDPSTSTTSEEKVGDFQTTFADGWSVTGPIYSDTVTMGSVKVTGQHFSPVISFEETYEDFPADGIIGLGFELNSVLHAPPFIQNAVTQGLITDSKFGLKLTKTNPSISIGGFDDTAYKGEIEYHHTSDDLNWELSGTCIMVNGDTVDFARKAAFDSGAEMIVGPGDAVDAVYNAIPGAKWHHKIGGFHYYTYPNDPPPNVCFTWGGKDWAISAENFDIGPADEPGQSFGAIIGYDDDLWLIGDSFLRNVYSVYEFGNHNRIGLAELA